jgi:hypothetical protein
MGVLGTAVVFPMLVYFLVLMEIFVRPWRVLDHVRRLKFSYAMSIGTFFSVILICAFGFMVWLVVPAENATSGSQPALYTSDTLTPAESKAFWFGMVGGVLSVVLVRRWIRRHVSVPRPAVAPFRGQLRFNPPPGWPPAPPGWTPPPGWLPPPNLPPAPPGWRFWV